MILWAWVGVVPSVAGEQGSSGAEASAGEAAASGSALGSWPSGWAGLPETSPYGGAGEEIGPPQRRFRKSRRLRFDRPRSEPDPFPVSKAPKPVDLEEPKVNWAERIKIRGYTQLRYNRIPSAVSNPDLINLQGDRSIGEGNGFFIRRARLIVYGDLHDHLSIYLQPDFASRAGGQMNSLVLRDWYADVFFDKKHRFRLRLGQSKVPFGFENLQSSQNRLALDRNDALNSAVRDERDIGAFFYWTPPVVQKRFRHLVQSGLKGSGDYGVFGLGIYNGQTANQPALTDDLHAVARFAYPFDIRGQFVEVNLGGYIGRYRISTQDQDTTRFRAAGDNLSMLDARVYGAVVVYPQPIGFQAEATWGVGPQQGRADQGEDPSLIDSRPLFGAYAQLMVKVDGPLKTDAILPFVRGTYYDGGKKFMPNAPHYRVKELEIGVEWQLFRNLELLLAYDLVDRTSDLYPYLQQSGHVTRVQVQVNLP